MNEWSRNSIGEPFSFLILCSIIQAKALNSSAVIPLMLLLYMSEREPIKGKVDNGHHEGKYSEVKRIAEAEFEIAEAWGEINRLQKSPGKAYTLTDLLDTLHEQHTEEHH